MGTSCPQLDPRNNPFLGGKPSQKQSRCMYVPDAQWRRFSRFAPGLHPESLSRRSPGLGIDRRRNKD
jgi:hypothetical protein